MTEASALRLRASVQVRAARRSRRSQASAVAALSRPMDRVRPRLTGELVRCGVPADLTPMYLRRPDATASAARKRVTQR